jgi:pimeloyl-ACP methyl ester carboxylesterase/class 3 adenylate cyclase/DNA-binding CsgD family transcriptional regulator
MPGGRVQPPRTRYATVGEIHIAYQTVGHGPLDVLFVPGFVSNVDDWWDEPTCVRFFEGLASFARVILFDKRGTGLSDQLARMPTLEQRAEDILAVLDAAGSQRAAVFGVSDGGALGALFAASHPDRTSSLVLYGTIAAFISWFPSPQEVNRFMRLVDDTWGTGASLSRYAPSMEADASFREWWARHERFGGSPGAVKELMRMSADVDIRPILPSIRVPVLVLHRRDDRAVTVDAGRYLARHISGAQYVELSGIDHLPWIGNSEAIVAEVQEFLTGARPQPEADRLLATVLAIRIRGAAPLVLRLGDRRWLDLLERFHALSQGEIQRFRGQELSLSGEALLASFDGPARAVRCAEAISQAVAALELDVQAGVHTGEIERASPAGITVEIASWMAELAGSGEILVSSTVKDLIAGSGLSFEERGLFTLPGAADQWRLYALRGASFVEPPARLVPSELTPREREIVGLVARGLTNRQIGEALVIAEGTAAMHVKRILAKLGFSSRTQVATWAVAHRLAARAANIQT